ncbi:MAG: hypothetical protein MOB07_12990 [Acidobacteria bacterium]|nr:hypothetical protein [Acidobacteriota bacterium]
MREKSLLYRLTLGLIIGALIMPAQPAQAQFGFGVVFDPKAYALQIAKRLEEAQRFAQMFDNAVKQFTTLKGVLQQAEDLVAKQRNAIATMSNIGRTVRASFQLKEQVQSIITTRLKMLKSIDDRLRRGIFDPEADMRDLEDYLKNSIGRTSQDTYANHERLARMDNELARWELELKEAADALSGAQRDRQEAQALLREEDAKPEPDRCAPCMGSLIEKMSNCDMLIAQYTNKIDELRGRIANRYKEYNLMMDERVKFAEQVDTANKAWSEFNNTLDEIQRALSKY